MNSEVKITIFILVCFVGGIVYLEFFQTDETLENIQPIESVEVIPVPEVKPIALPAPPVELAPKQEDPVVAPEPVVQNVEPEQAPEPEVEQPERIAEPVRPVSKPKDQGIEPKASIPNDYVVQKGDTVSSISERVLGSVHFQSALMKANPELQPHRLYAGIRLAMPSKSELTSLAKVVNKKNKAEGNYLVQKGDTLYKIAVRECGSASKVKEIIKLNPNVDPRKLMVGQRLRLPENN
jgi:LysM repeat protein